jgi:hypothetical protein
VITARWCAVRLHGECHALERFANKANKVGWNGLPLGVKLLIQNALGTARTVLPLILVRGGRLTKAKS